MLKKFPVAVCGLALGLASLGNLLPAFWPPLRYVCGGVSFLILLAFTIRALTDFGSIRKELENPVAFSVLPTYTMAVMLLSGYAKPFAGDAAVAVWFAALALQFVIMAAFVRTFVVKFNIENVFPSWFVMFVGIVVASVTSPVMEQKEVGRLVFFAGFTLYMALLPVVLYRVLKIGGIPQPARPTAAIFTAPANLCFVGYMSAFDEKSVALAVFMIMISLIFWLAVVFSLPKLLRLPFFPSYSAFTFPFVISATAYKAGSAFFTGALAGALGALSLFALIIAVAAVLYVLLRYCMFWFAPPAAELVVVPEEN